MEKPENATPVVGLATCRFDIGASGCTPIAAVCPDGRLRAHLFLGHLNAFCVGEVELRIATTPDGGATVEWNVLELEPASASTCRTIPGSERSGTLIVGGPCCEGTLDIPIPRVSSVYRMVVRTDWKP